MLTQHEIDNAISILHANDDHDYSCDMNCEEILIEIRYSPFEGVLSYNPFNGEGAFEMFAEACNSSVAKFFLKQMSHSALILGLIDKARVLQIVENSIFATYAEPLILALKALNGIEARAPQIVREVALDIVNTAKGWNNYYNIAD